MSTRVCGESTSDGNRDDPSYMYCDLPYAHAGEHHYADNPDMGMSKEGHWYTR